MTTNYANTWTEVDTEMETIFLHIARGASPNASEIDMFTKDRIQFVNSVEDVAELFDIYQRKTKQTQITYPLLSYTPNGTTESIQHGTGVRSTVFGIRTNLPNGETKVSKAKGVESDYNYAIWTDSFEKARYYQNNLTVNCLDRYHFHKYHSNVLNRESYIFTMLDAPVLNKIPKFDDKKKQSGYIYVVAGICDVWAILSEPSFPMSTIEQISLTVRGMEGQNQAFKSTIVVDGDDAERPS